MVSRIADRPNVASTEVFQNQNAGVGENKNNVKAEKLTSKAVEANPPLVDKKLTGTSSTEKTTNLPPPPPVSDHQIALQLPDLEGPYADQNEFTAKFNQWSENFRDEINDYLRVPSPDAVAEMDLNALDQEVRKFIKRVNNVSDSLLKDKGTEKPYDVYVRQRGMSYLRDEVDPFLESLEQNEAFMEEFGSAREVLARKYGVVRNITNSDVVNSGISFDTLAAREEPGKNQYPAYRPDELTRYNYFAKIDSWKNPDPEVGNVLKDVFGDKAESIRYAVSSEPNTFRGWNVDGIPVINEKNIEVAAGRDPEKTAIDTRHVIMNELGHTAMYQILGEDAFRRDLTWFNDFPNMKGLDIPSAFQFNEFASDVASVAFAAKFDRDDGLSALSRLFNTGDDSRYGFSRSVAHKALEGTLTPQQVDKLSQISDEVERTQELRQLTQGKDVVSVYLDFSKTLLQHMLEHADGKAPQKYSPPEA